MVDILTEETFDAVVGADTVPYLVDFWATWCGRCRLLAPAVAALEREHEGRLRVGAVDVEAEPELARRFEVTSLPTLILLAPGELDARLTGVVTPAQLRGLVADRRPPASGS